MASDCTHKEASLVFVDDLDGISILLDEDNVLEEEITHLLSEVSFSIFKFEKINQNSKYTQNMYHKTG